MWFRRASLCCAVLALFFASLLTHPAHAQTRSLNYRVFSAVHGAAEGTTPFWHYANTRGRVRPGSSTNWVSGTGLALPFRDGEGLDVSLGGEVVGRVSDRTNTLHVLQLYGKVQYQGLRLSVGRFPETIGSTRPALSSGSMIISRNAPPVSKIKLFTPDYLDIPFTNSHIQVRGRWSDGILGSHRTVERALLHQKTVYLKLNLGPLAASGGLIQNTIWGGKGRSHELRDYINLFVGSQAGAGRDSNRVGNTVAAYDFALQYDFGDWTLRASRLFYLEDTVSTRFRSPWDGMWGLSLHRATGYGWVDGFVYEHVNTIQQDALPSGPRGRASYYNHFIFESGWTYESAVLGNPLLVFSPKRDQVTNNMVIGHHLGIRGTLSPQLNYTVRLTYSRNYGVCGDQIISGTCRVTSDRPAPPNQDLRPRGELRQDQYSVFGEVRYRLSVPPGLQFIASTAMDVGEFYEDRWGIKIGLQWNGSIPVR